MPAKKKIVKEVPSSVNAILQDPITSLAGEHWVGKSSSEIQYDEDLVISTFTDHIIVNDRAFNRIHLLNLSGYLENYLWATFHENVAAEHLMSILFLINEKFKENITDIFDVMTVDEKKFQAFFTKVVEFASHPDLFTRGYVVPYFKFLINFYRSLENPIVRKTGLRYLFLPIWGSLSSIRLNEELELYPQLMKLWTSLKVSKQANTQATTTSQPSDEIPDEPVNVGKKSKRGSKSKAETPIKKTKISDSETIPRHSTTTSPTLGKESIFIPTLINQFLSKVDDISSTQSSGDQDIDTIKYFEIVLEFLCDLLSQLPTRRFLRTVLDDMNIVTKIKLSCAYKASSHNSVLCKMVDVLDRYMNFAFHDHTGKALSSDDMLDVYYARIMRLQKIVYKDYFDDMKDIVFSSIGRLLRNDSLRKLFLPLKLDDIINITKQLGRISTEEVTILKSKASSQIMNENDDENEELFDYLLRILLDYLTPKPNEMDEINMLSLYPTEDVLWNDSIMPPAKLSDVNHVLALPKLNLQFLTLYDYLSRNFHLYRLETAYEIREDLMDTIKRMQPKDAGRNTVTFKGWARMALPMLSLTVDDIGKPRLTSPCPSHVRATLKVDLSRFTGSLRDDWEALREHDVIFLVCIEKPRTEEGSPDDLPFPEQYGVKYIRGAEVFEHMDEDSVVLNDPTKPDTRSSRTGSKRQLRINLDAAQYYADMKKGRTVYESFNLVIRRDPRESNFRSVLDTIRNIMNADNLGSCLPPWLSDVFLGYGNPSSASYRSLKNADNYDYVDTFLNAGHVTESYPNAQEITIVKPDNTSFTYRPGYDTIPVVESDIPPFKLSFRYQPSSSIIENLTIKSYLPPRLGPYPDDMPPKNTVRFTPAQVEAIHSGMNPGLTLIVGPPGSGKTDTAVQIIANLYHNFPTQKIVLVTHSNAALNDLFMKIMERNVEPRHLLRLGSGERELRDSLSSNGKSNAEEFTKQGRVNWCLERRFHLLGQVQHLSQSIQCIGDHGSSCETAEYFFKYDVQPRIIKFEADVSSLSDAASVSDIFPFSDYFSDTPEPIFTGIRETDLESARGCIHHIEKLFNELSDYRAFELLRTQAHRSDYLLLKQARIVAMTCTHAAIIRSRLLELDFKYDSLVMEEAAQILDVETMIPMLLQNHDTINGCRLKRVVLIGDHHQLPPIIQNTTLQKYSKFDQSLFSRLVRLGVPSITLDKQGRARPEISALYSWRYKQLDGSILGDLEDAVVSSDFYQRANTGFLHTFQMINVPEFKGKGEYAPTPYFYQNLGEAEYVVATYQYMRLMGYPAEKISIITTYNGQKHLIDDIINQRCKNPIFGRPGSISTVDRFQGQQNDYILLSLVRTESVGHIRDIRRLTVALSRARLGLYVFCRKELYENCFELSSAFGLLAKKPSVLQLVVGESFPTTRGKDQSIRDKSKIFEVEDVTTMGVLVYQLSQHASTQPSSSSHSSASSASTNEAHDESSSMTA